MLIIALAIITLVAGIASLLIGMVVNYQQPTSVTLAWCATGTGAGSLAIGFFAQMNSITRLQRILIVSGMIAAFVGGVLGIAHGGTTI